MIPIVRDVMLSCACALLTLVLMLDPASAQTVPKFEIDPGWPRTLPNNWIIGTIGGITVDAQDHIWINQRPSALDAREKRALTAPNVKCCVPAPPVIEFDQDGKVVQGWGGDGAGYTWGNDGHGIHVDHNNFVWVGDNVETGGHIFKFHARRQVRDADRQARHAGRVERHRTSRPARRHGGRIARPTSCSSPMATATSAHSCSMPRPAAYKRHWGAMATGPATTRSLGFQGPPPQQFPTRCIASPSH